MTRSTIHILCVFSAAFIGPFIPLMLYQKAKEGFFVYHKLKPWEIKH